MRPRRAICVSQDSAVASRIGATLAAAGLDVEHHPALPADTRGVAVLVIDGAARRAAGDALRSLGVPVVVVGDDLDDAALIQLMGDAPISHVISDPADRTLGITSAKLASGDLFGLELYLAPGAAIHERVVRSAIARRRAVDELTTWAETVGARRATRHRLTSVADELLMNALSDSGTQADAVPVVVLRWATDHDALAISVTDDRGALGQREIVEHVQRAQRDRGRPRAVSDGGAGLGLYLVLANVASLIINVRPGACTEVVCLFDLARGRRRPRARGRSLHVFRG